MRRILAALASVLLMSVLGACGGDGDDPPPTTVTTQPTTTTTRVPQGDAKGIACLKLATDALALFNDFTVASRGIIAPDEAPYRERADELRAEQARLGCPGELLKGFLDY